MMRDLEKKYGEFGAEIAAFIEACVSERLAEHADVLSSLSARRVSEDFDWSSDDLAKKAGCGRDMIIHYVHSGVLKGCFTKHGRHFKFKPQAALKAIISHSETQIYGTSERNTGNVLEMTGKTGTRRKTG